MSATINNLSFEEGDETYYTGGFHNFFLSYYFYFKDTANNLLTTLTIDPGIAYRYQGDFISLLNYYKVPPPYHWCVMVLNNISSPVKPNINLTQLLLPDYNEVESLKNLYESVD